MQRGCGGRGHPSGVGAGTGVADLRIDHLTHDVRRRPHALADLRHAGEATLDPHVHVPVLVGEHPWAALDLWFGDHGPGGHTRVDLISRAVEETRVDEDHAIRRGADTLLEVDRGPPLFVHDADLQSPLRHSQRLFDTPEQLHREGDLLGTVHFGLHYIDAARTAVTYGAVAFEVVEGAPGRHQGVQESLRDRLAIGCGDRVGVHVDPDVAHKEEAAPR